MGSNETQHNTTKHTPKNRRETVEVLPTAKNKFPKTHVNFWRGRLRRQRYGSKADGTYREAQAVYVRIYHQGRERAFTFHTLHETVAATNARDIYLSILKEGWDAVLRKHQSSAEQAADNPTLGQFLAEVSAKAGLRVRTFRNYTNCFRTIIAEVFKIRGGGSRFDYHGEGTASTTKGSPRRSN
jgi:hypothetical protein